MYVYFYMFFIFLFMSLGLCIICMDIFLSLEAAVLVCLSGTPGSVGRVG